MSVQRVVMLSAHTSPLAQPGSGDGGGMNVYVRSLAAALARAGVECEVLTRREHPGQDTVVDVEPGFRVVHLDAGPTGPLDKEALPSLADDLADAAEKHLLSLEPFDAIHAHYWVSGEVGHLLKHRLELPLVTTFHTLAHTKVAAGITSDPRGRARTETEIVGCSDLVLASTPDERAELVCSYGAEPSRVEVVPPGVDHSIFSPGDQAEARRRLRLRDDPMLLFVGRIQALKGLDLALGCLAALSEARATLTVIGGPSGPEGEDELVRLRRLAHDLGIEDRVRWIDPQPHPQLADWYRAADVCLVPSRTESFGLVALEAAACGTPVVAANVGGLRRIVDNGHTGFLARGRAVSDYVLPVERLLADRGLARAVGRNAVLRSGDYTWNMTATRLRRLYADVRAGEPVRCR